MLLKINSVTILFHHLSTYSNYNFSQNLHMIFMHMRKECDVVSSAISKYILAMHNFYNWLKNKEHYQEIFSRGICSEDIIKIVIILLIKNVFSFWLCLQHFMQRERSGKNAKVSAYPFHLIHCHQPVYACPSGGPHVLYVSFLQYHRYYVLKGQPRSPSASLTTHSYFIN